MSDRKRPTNIGGQAVIEGVMMRGKKIYAMAVRNPEGEIVVEKKPVGGLGKKGLFRYPIFRGMAAFVDSLVTGTKILMRSAEIAGEGWEEEELSPFEQWLKEKLGDKINDILIYFSVFISLLLGMGLFFVLPVAIGNLFKTLVPTWALGIIEGLIRIAIFLGYLWLISRMKEIKRVFQYHGAEHKTIACFESGKELTVENVRRQIRFHPRCGTSFLILVVIVSVFLYSVLPWSSTSLRVVFKLLLLPLVMGISYELLKWCGRSDNIATRIIRQPGLWVQRLTVFEPDDSMIEVAIAAVTPVLPEDPEDGKW